MLLKQPDVCINAMSGTVPPLWAACRAGSLATVQSLLTKKSIQVNQKAPTGTSPLHVAVINQRSDIVSLLLSQEGIAVNDVGPFGFSALMFAAVNGYTACVGRLVHHPSIDLMVKDTDGYCAFRLAVLNGHVRSMNLLRSALVRQMIRELDSPEVWPQLE